MFTPQITGTRNTEFIDRLPCLGIALNFAETTNDELILILDYP